MVRCVVLPLILLAGSSAVSTIAQEANEQQHHSRSHIEHRRKSLQIFRKDHEVAEPRIVGGGGAKRDAYKFFVRVDVNGNAHCGGCLVAPDIVVTAAHCFKDGISVVVNGYDRSSPIKKKEQQARQVEYARLHPQYNKATKENDIMLLKLKRQVDYQYIRLNFNGTNPRAGDALIAMGLGVTKLGGPRPQYLREVTLRAVGNNQCTDMFRKGGLKMWEKVMLCAGSEGKDTCTGDSGGPLIDSNGQLVGITSWGAGCGKKGFPGVYTRITGVNNWLKRHICSISDYPPDWCETKGLNKEHL